MTTDLPISATRYVTDIDLPSRFLNSKRYNPFSSHLYKPVTKPGFKGVWIIRDGFTGPTSSTSSTTSSEIPVNPNADITILYLHGGGYATSTPATYTLFLLALAENIIKSRSMTTAGKPKTVNIFALDYDLAPEAVFPTQLQQARRAYDWFLASKQDNGLEIDKKNVLVMGDSAGGHLALGLCVDLWRSSKGLPSILGDQSTSVTSSPSKNTRTRTNTSSNNILPGIGLVLNSPWLNPSASPQYTPASFTRNHLIDLISPEFVHMVGRNFIGSSPHPTDQTSYIDFQDNTNNKFSWHEILPQWTWVSAGRLEIFHDDIVSWFDQRRRDVDGVDGKVVQGEIDKMEVHDYAWLETMDRVAAGEYCGMSMDGDGNGNEKNGGKKGKRFEAIERLAGVVVARMEEVK